MSRKGTLSMSDVLHGVSGEYFTRVYVADMAQAIHNHLQFYLFCNKTVSEVLTSGSHSYFTPPSRPQCVSELTIASSPKHHLPCNLSFD